MTPSLRVEAGRLRGAAAAVSGLAERAAEVAGAAWQADVDPRLWGLLGEAIGAPGGTGRRPAPCTRTWPPPRRRWSGPAAHQRGPVRVGRPRRRRAAAPLMDDDLLYRAPGVGQVASAVRAGRHGEVGEAIQQCGELGIATFEVVFGDPLQVLIGAGLSWLVGAFRPLEEELAKVTGNVDRLRDDCERWQHVGAEVDALAGGLREVLDRDLAGWVGEAAGQARLRLGRFAEGLDGVAGEVDDLRRLLLASAGLMEVARGLVLDIVATFVEWAALTWLVAQAAAVPSLGASEALAVAQLELEAALATTRAARVTATVEAALLRVDRALMEVGATVHAHLPSAALELAGHTGRALRDRIGDLSAGAMGLEAAGLIDAGIAGLRAETRRGHASQLDQEGT